MRINESSCLNVGMACLQHVGWSRSDLEKLVSGCKMDTEIEKDLLGCILESLCNGQRFSLRSDDQCSNLNSPGCPVELRLDPKSKHLTWSPVLQEGLPKWTAALSNGSIPLESILRILGKTTCMARCNTCFALCYRSADAQVRPFSNCYCSFIFSRSSSGASTSMFIYIYVCIYTPHRNRPCTSKLQLAKFVLCGHSVFPASPIFCLV